MHLLESIPAPVFESLGVFAGLSACLVLAIQIRKEYLSKSQSSITATFLFGWILIYAFWGIYGIRFGAIALWITNGIALVLQILLSAVVLKKQRNLSN